MYGILTTKNALNTHFFVFCFLYPPVGISYETPAVFSQHTWTPFSTVSLFNLGNILMELFAMFIGEFSHVFRKKIQMGTQKMVPMTCHIPQHCMMKLAAAQFHCNFPLFHYLESFLRRFQMPSRLFFMQKLLLHSSLGLRIVV